MAYAHSKSGCPISEWHTLEDHLRDTAERARRFASKFGSGDWGHYAGLWHDLGKYAPDWQEFLRNTQDELSTDASTLGEDTPDEERVPRKRGPDHSTAGAIHVTKSFKPYVAKLLASTIAAHHAGLADDVDLDARLGDEAKQERYKMALAAASREITSVGVPPLFPRFFPGTGDEAVQKRRFEMLTRMLYSTLVDADFLDTERFMELEGERSEQRAAWPELSSYLSPLDNELRRLAVIPGASENVRRARSTVLQACLASSSLPRGSFTLTVPTGGGKTLASLAFALRHALEHRLDRVIVALPFLSIIDQTAQVFRRIFEPLFGDSVLVEHHSNIVPKYDTVPNRLASENWDAPLIVTTQVQLFESLFRRRSSDCRKLHNLTNSVIILDEVQTLPIGLLDPILEVLQELSANYGASLLLTTATQPAFHSRSLGVKRFRGLSPAPREIIPDETISDLFESLRRVEVVWATQATTEWTDLAQKLIDEPQVLAIVHRKADAAALWKEVCDRTPPGTFHLSGLMCAAHRRKILQEVHRRLDDHFECRVVSTQLVEAGVDIDFPVVFRAMAGLESLAQSAGRCNREGKIERGRFTVFRAPTEPVGSLRHHKDVADQMLRADPALDLFAPSTFLSYFDRLYAERDRDEKQVQVARQSWQFEETSARFRMIDDATETVFIPFDPKAIRAIDDLRRFGPSRGRFRAIQSYGVAVYPSALKKLRDRGAIELLHESVWVLSSGRDYDENLGLLVEREAFELNMV